MKTACEEAAEILCEDFMPPRHYAGDNRDWRVKERLALEKRLRSEARELKRLRRMVVRLNDEQFKYKFAERVPLFMAVRREAARIQKARKK